MSNVVKKAWAVAILALALCGSAQAHPAAPVCHPVVSAVAGGGPAFPLFFPFLQAAIVTAPAWINSSLIVDAANAVGLKTYNEYP